MKRIAIITARGGSKRIPRKNIKEFLGKPIISYSIAAALESNLFDEVMVSTEDREIAEIAISYGAKVPFYRSKETADDFAATADVLKEVIDEYQKRGAHFDWLCCIYPTAPFVTAEKLRACMERVLRENGDALIPVVKFSYPPQRCFVIDGERGLKFKWPENANQRSQDLEALYHDAGQFYFAKINRFLESGTLVFGRTFPYLLDEMEVQDIDCQEDWDIAELKYQCMVKKERDKNE